MVCGFYSWISIELKFPSDEIIHAERCWWSGWWKIKSALKWTNKLGRLVFGI